MKLITTVMCLFLFGSFAQLEGQSFDESEYDALEYRLVGPFRGGRSAAVTGVPNT